ncbi:MAG: cobalt transporter, partial [Gammaproteobacteria bacterium]|nr:cobalt transporter [Gammaproteobacteria bacterium]
SVEKLDDGVYLLDSRMSVSDVNDILEINLNTKSSHTIGGLVMAHLGRIPEQGEDIVEQGYRFVVETTTDRAVQKLRVEPVA